jgi:hypothetical protein
MIACAARAARVMLRGCPSMLSENGSANCSTKRGIEAACR